MPLDIQKSKVSVRPILYNPITNLVEHIKVGIDIWPLVSLGLSESTILHVLHSLVFTETDRRRRESTKGCTRFFDIETKGGQKDNGRSH